MLGKEKCLGTRMGLATSVDENFFLAVNEKQLLSSSVFKQLLNTNGAFLAEQFFLKGRVVTPVTSSGSAHFLTLNVILILILM